LFGATASGLRRAAPVAPCRARSRGA
jgi:hypothetical protein